MKIAVIDHHGKSVYLVQKLSERFELATDSSVRDYELLLVDTDHRDSPPAPHKHRFVMDAARRGVPIVLYPHGGGPDLDRDGIRKFDVPISLQLLPGEGHAEIYRRCGLGHRWAVVGWTYGPVLPPPPAGPRVESILFAPIHPWANGETILPPHKLMNQRAYRAFLDHPAERKTVRMFGNDEPNGVFERADGVRYTQASLHLGPAEEQIAEHDAVISYGTVAYTALAMGKPTVMIYGYPAHHSDDGQVEAAHFADYRDYCKYPATVGDAPLDDLFKVDTSEWRDLFVGKELDLGVLEETLRSLRPSRAIRRALARA